MKKGVIKAQNSFQKTSSTRQLNLDNQSPKEKGQVVNSRKIREEQTFFL